MVTEESPLRDLARIIVWYPFRWAVSMMAPRRALAAMAALGRLHSRRSAGKRLMLKDNLAVLEDLATQPLLMAEAVEQYFETHYVSQLLAFLFPKLNERSTSTIHAFRGLQKIDRELARGKGCILVHAHFGPVHLPLFHLGIKRYKVKQIGYLRRPQGLSRIGERVSFRNRERLERLIPAEIVQADRFLGSAFRHLKNNGILMMTGDGTGRGEFVGSFKPFSFLGRRMLFPLGPAKLAKRTGAGIIPIFTIQEESSPGYVTVVEDPLPLRPGTADESEITARFLSLFELYIRRYPGLWHFWDEFRAGQLLVEEDEPG